MLRDKRYSVLMTALAVVLVVSIFVQLYHVDVGASANSNFLNVTIDPAGQTKLSANTPYTYTASVSNSYSGDCSFVWSISPQDNKTKLEPNGATCTLTFLEATDEPYSLVVSAEDSVLHNKGTAFLAVHDPYTSPNLYLGSYGMPYTVLVTQDGLGWYRLINGVTGSVTDSTNAYTILQAAVNALPAAGGIINGVAGTYPTATELDFPVQKNIKFQCVSMDMLLATSGGFVISYSGTEFAIGCQNKTLSSWYDGIVTLDGIKIVLTGNAAGGINSTYINMAPYDVSIYGSVTTKTSGAIGWVAGPISNGVEPNLDNIMISAFTYGANISLDHVSINHLTITDCTGSYLKLAGTGITVQYLHTLVGDLGSPRKSIVVSGVAQGCFIGQWHLEDTNLTINPTIEDAIPGNANDSRACLTIGGFTSNGISYPTTTNGNSATSKGDAAVVIQNWNGKIALKVPTWNGHNAAVVYYSNIPASIEGYYSLKLFVNAASGTYNFSVKLNFTDKFGTNQTFIVPMAKGLTGQVSPYITNVDGHGIYSGSVPLFITDNSGAAIKIFTEGTFSGVGYGITAIFDQYAV